MKAVLHTCDRKLFSYNNSSLIPLSVSVTFHTHKHVVVLLLLLLIIIFIRCARAARARSRGHVQRQDTSLLFVLALFLSSFCHLVISPCHVTLSSCSCRIITRFLSSFRANASIPCREFSFLTCNLDMSTLDILSLLPSNW